VHSSSVHMRGLAPCMLQLHVALLHTIRSLAAAAAACLATVAAGQTGVVSELSADTWPCRSRRHAHRAAGASRLSSARSVSACTNAPSSPCSRRAGRPAAWSR